VPCPALAELYVLTTLSPDETAEFEAHLAVCETCTAEVRAARAVLATMAQLALPVDPAPEVRQRVLSEVSRAHGREVRLKADPTGRSAGTDGSADAHGSAATHGWVAWLALAASVAIAVGGGAYAVHVRIEAVHLRDEAVHLRDQAAQEQVSVAVLTAADLARIDLAGQPTAPKASGRAYWSRSRGLVFTASALPAPPAGRAYQLWVITSQPAPISAGMVNPDAGGAVRVMFNTPPDLAQPVAMALTLEPAGGVPAPTGEKYLVGLAPTQSDTHPPA